MSRQIQHVGIASSILLACVTVAFVSVSHAGVSGPGGPRFNYDAPPRLAPYATPSPTKPSKRIPANPVDTSPNTANVGASPSTPGQAPRAAQKIDKSTPKSAPQVSGRTVRPPTSAEQRRKILSRLYGHLAAATSTGQAKQLAHSIERIWQHTESPTIEVLMRRADRAMETGRWESAEGFANAIVKLQPDYTEGLMRRALVYSQRQRLTPALRDLRRVIALEPNHFIAQERIAAILHQIGKHKASLDAYKKLKQIHPQAPGLDDLIDTLTRKVEGEPI